MINYQAAYRKLYRHLDTYSGSQFLKLMQKNDPELPDFDAYIETRRKSGKSTMRKEYFKDIIFSYPEEIKLQLFEKFIDEYGAYNPDEAKTLRGMLVDKAK